MRQHLLLHLFFFFLHYISSGFLIPPVIGYTDEQDVSSLNAMYSSLNYNPQLTSWRDLGGDPCGEAWKGVICSGITVTEIRLPGLGLTGNLEGYYLEKMISLTILDLSNNNIGAYKEIPYSFPPKLLHLDLSNNGHTGTLTWSLTKMPSLQYLSISNNQLRGGLDDMFGNFYSLSTIDLSGNSFSGSLPPSFRNLKNLETLHLQNNKLTGTIDVLSDLPLEELNIANNQFTGGIPERLKSIEMLQSGGNSWNTGAAPGSKASGGSEGKSGLSGGAIAGIVIAIVIVLSLAALFLILSVNRNREKSCTPTTKPSRPKPVKTSTPFTVVNPPPVLTVVNPPPFSAVNPMTPSNLPVSVGATVYSVSDLQIATGSFDADNFLGDGCVGGVYRAQFEDGRIMAVKNVDSSKTSGDFMEVVSNISIFHHPNVSELVGYCSEYGQHLLVYEFHRNGSLYDLLYLSDEQTKPLTWETRMKITLGTAHAFEYLHEVCSPSIMHKNVKSSNILLDEDLNPRVSDCGLSDLITNVKDQALADHVGSGYCAPEVAESGNYTVKSDVFSFGVVMLELLTGRKPFDSSRLRSDQSLVRWATPQLHDIDALDKMVDPALQGMYSPQSLSRFADVIALCVQKEPEFRPPMSDIAQALLRLVQREQKNVDAALLTRRTWFDEQCGHCGVN